jgi:twitching motility protein PilT
MVRADGDALVMHVGERPYVVTQAGTLDLSTHGLNLGAMTGMLQQLLPAEAQSSLEEFGAVEHTLPSLGDDRFTMVAARGGDDIWIEIRRRRIQMAAVAEPVAEPASAYAPDEVVAADAAAMVESAAPEPVESAYARGGEPVESAYARENSDELRRDSADLSAEASAQAEAAYGRSGEPVEPAEPVEPGYTPYDSDKLRWALAEAAAGFEGGPAAELELEPVAEVHVELVAETRAPVPEMIAPGPEIVAATPEIDPVALLDQLIPVADPDVDEIDYEFAAAAAAAAADLQHSAQKPVEPVEPVSARDYTDALKDDLAAIAFPDSERAEVFVVETPVVASAPVVLNEPEAAAPEPEVATSDPGVVLQMTRGVRTDAPSRRMMPSRTSMVERLLRIAFARGASSLFLSSESRPCIRVEGDIRVLDSEAVLSKADVESAIMEIVPQEAQESIGSGQATEWISQLPGLGEIRCTSSMDHRGPGVVFTMIATRAATAEQLGLPREIQALATEAEGLVLVTGSRGSGKSTLMSALVDLVNHQRAEYVITLERQIRLVHDNHTALVSQREIRGGAEAALAAARAALRENPDVLVVDDLSSTQMVPLLLEAAAGGLLVFVSITAPSTSDALERLLDLAPPGTRTSVQAAMAETFRGAVSQVLLKKSGGGRVVAREIMLATAAVTRLIGDGQLAQLPLALESGRRHGMVPLTDVLLGLVQSGVVDVREAFRKTHDRDRLLSGLKREGIDTSVVERLA